MPVEFLADDEAAAYGRYAGAPSQADLERVFFLEEDRALVDRRRGEHMKLGFALQLVTVRWLGTFLEDPLEVPGAVLDFVARQLGVADPSQVKRYTERRKTRFDHQWEIRRACKLKEFTDVETEFADWVAARSWTSGDGPKAIFLDGMAWLRERKVLLPGVTTLARLVAKVRDDTTRRLWGVLEGLLTTGQRYVLDQLLEVPPGSRISDLERWRKGPPPRGSGPMIIKALDQVSEIMALGLAELGAEALVPPRRLGELARYGMSADASLIRRHPDGRRLATLLATVRHLEAKSVDDTLELISASRPRVGFAVVLVGVRAGQCQQPCPHLGWEPSSYPRGEDLLRLVQARPDDPPAATVTAHPSGAGPNPLPANRPTQNRSSKPRTKHHFPPPLCPALPIDWSVRTSSFEHKRALAGNNRYGTNVE